MISMFELRDQARFEEAIRGTDVRGILAGHFHFSTFSTFAEVPVSVASATCYTQDVNVEPGSMRGQNGAQAFNLVHVYGDRVVNTVVPIGEFATVYEVTADQMKAFSQLSLEEVSAEMSAKAAH
jgi:hypothetical protein